MFSIVALCGAVAVPAQIRRPTNRPPAPASARHPPLKAIFEPARYPRDVRIEGIFFVNAETGWICGDGFIAGTRNGGRSWSPQFGDGNRHGPPLRTLQFVDEKHGWAIGADGTLLRTQDGSTWVEEAPLPPARPGVFISARTGFALDADGIRRSDDGGHTWRPSYQCREHGCEPRAIVFAPDRATGYLLADVRGTRTSALIKTSDGGATWAPLSVIDAPGDGATLRFADPLTGFLLTREGLRMSTDGGATWHAVTVPVPADTPSIAVAGAVGWMVGPREFSYTFDGGTRWIARRVEFPGEVVTFTVLGDESGYVAGAHGLIYRFRIVPFAYSVPGMLTIPGMTTFVGSPLGAEEDPLFQGR